MGVVPDTHSGRPTSQQQGEPHRKWLIVIGLAQRTRPCTFGGFEKISILRASPAPDQSPATDVRLPNYRGIQERSHLPWPVWTIEPDRVGLNHSESIIVIVQNVYNVAGRDRISSLSNNTWPCNYTEDFVWDWPYHPKFVTYVLVFKQGNMLPHNLRECTSCLNSTIIVHAHMHDQTFIKFVYIYIYIYIYIHCCYE